MAFQRFIAIAFAVVVMAAPVLTGCESREERDWKSAQSDPNAEFYEYFVTEYPESQHVAEARTAAVQIYYDRAVEAGTIRALNDFLAAHADARQVADAEARIAALRTNRSVWESVAASGDEVSIRNFLVDYPGHVVEAEAHELLRTYDGIDLYELLAAGSVAVEASGAGVANVNLTLRNLSGRTTKVIVPAGAYFRSGNPSVQSMVTTAPAEIWLPAGKDPLTTTVSAACANLHLAEPFGGDGLTLAQEPLTGDLARVLAGTAALDLTARQAAVWIMTDDASYSDLSVLNTMTGAYAAQGARLVAESGVDLSSRRIWDDMPYLFAESMRAGWDDEALWVWNAIGRPLQPEVLSEYEHPYLADAAECACFRVMDALIEAGADVNQRFPHFEGETNVIALAQDRATVERLLAVGAEFDGRRLWERSVRLGTTDLIALLRERGEHPPSDLPLMALGQGNVEVIRVLLDEGAPIDVIDEYGRTPLHAAIYSPEAVALLLAAGADPNVLDGSGQSVLRTAITEAFADANLVRQLLAAGADPQGRDQWGNTLLHDLALTGAETETLRLLLDAGLDPNAVNAEGQTPLHAAAESYYDVNDFVTALIDAGARRMPDANGRLPEDVISPDSPAPDELRAILAKAPE